MFLQLQFTSSDPKIKGKCSCTAGKGTCNHQLAVLYQLAHYQNLGLKTVPPIVSRTSAPQQWHIPPRTHGIKPAPVASMTVVAIKPPKIGTTTVQKTKKQRTMTGKIEHTVLRYFFVNANNMFRGHNN